MTSFLRTRREASPARNPRPRSRARLVEMLEERTLLSGTAADGYIGSIPPLAAPQTAKGDWTVMVYITATDLAENTPPNLVEMEKAVAKLPGSVRIVVLYDQWANQGADGKSYAVAKPGSADVWKNKPGALTYPTGSGTQPAWSTAGLAVVSPHNPSDGNGITSTFTISTSEVDTGDPQILENFISYASMAAPAEHYALVMWDHGGGVTSFNNDTFDVLPNGELTTSKLVGALNSVEDRVRFDLVGFDECLMSTAEVAYALRDLTPVVVASEELENGEGWNYETALDALMTPQAATAQDLARSIVKSYEDRYGPRGDDRDTMAALNTSGTAALASAIRSFVTSTASASRGDWTAILGAYAKTPFFGGQFKDDYRDLGRFMTAISTSASTKAIRDAAQAVASTLTSEVVFDKTEDRRRTMGLSIGLPPVKSAVSPEYTSQITTSGFLAATDWNQFQSRFYAAAIRTRILARGESNWAYNEYGADSALDLGTLAGSRLQVPVVSIGAGSTAWYKFSTAATGGRGDGIREVRAGGSGRLVFSVYGASNPQAMLRRGVGSVDVRGLAAGDYLLAVSAPARPPATRFGLSVHAPARSPKPVDAPDSNGSMSTAVNLHTIYNSLLVPNQSRSTTARASWYAFQTPRSIEPYDATVSLIGDGQPLTLTLLDDEGGVLKTSRGVRNVRVTYSVPGDGESYHLKVDGAPGAFSIYFSPNSIA